MSSRDSPNVTMALDGTEIAVDLVGADSVKEVRQRVAKACGVCPLEITLLQNEAIVLDSAAVGPEPIRVIVKNPMEGRYTGTLDVYVIEGDGGMARTSIPLSIKIDGGFMHVADGDGGEIAAEIQPLAYEFKVGSSIPVLMPRTDTVRVCNIEEVKEDEVKLHYSADWNPSEVHDEWLQKESPRITDLMGKFEVRFSEALGPWRLKSYVVQPDMTMKRVTFTFAESDQSIAGAWRDIEITDERAGCYACTAFDGGWAFDHRGKSDSFKLSLGPDKEFRFTARKTT